MADVYKRQAYSPESTIRARCWSFKEEEVIDASWFEKKLRHAVEARACQRDRTSAVRLVFGEADGLPGLIVDQYADCLVTQFQSAGVEAHRELIADLLMEITGAKTIFDRSDAATRQREGLPIRSELLRGEEPPAAIEVVEDGVRYGVDVRVGHKTGFYVCLLYTSERRDRRQRCSWRHSGRHRQRSGQPSSDPCRRRRRRRAGSSRRTCRR